MKSYHIIPSLIASVLAITLTGCSSNGSSYSPDHAADKAHQEYLAKKKAEREKKEQEEKVEKENIIKEKMDWRNFTVAVSSEGGDKYNPAIKEEGIFYSSGPIVLSKENKAVKLSENSLNYEREFFKKGNIDPKSIQSLVITDTSGKELGKFQFVNQEYSSYATFMSTKPVNEYDPNYDVSEALAFYTAKPSTPTQLAAQKGSFDYNGKVLGYQGGINGKTPTQAATADVQFKVDFDNKTISGRIENRFDSLGFESLAFTKDWDENDDPIYIPEYNDRTSRPLILAETPIKVEKGIVGFGHTGATDKNVGIILNDGKYLGFTDYGGIFSGPNLEEVVGQIGGGEDRIMFGATKEKK